MEPRFKAWQLQYKLVYCEPTNKTAMFMDFKSDMPLGRITVWVSGECDMEVLDNNTGVRVFDEVRKFESEQSSSMDI